MSHTGTSGKTHWGYVGGDSQETCKSCKDYDRKHQNEDAGGEEWYEALPEILTGAELKSSLRTIRRSAKFSVSGSSYYPATVFGKGPLPFTGFKAVSRTMSSINGGRYDFGEPKNGQPGDWAELPLPGIVELCAKGFHFTDIRHLPSWAADRDSDTRVFRIEIDGPWMGGQDKYVARKIRLTEELNKDQLLKLAHRLIAPDRPPDVTEREAAERIDELKIKTWFPELITSTDPLVVEVREAAEAQDPDRYTSARQVVLNEEQAVRWEIKAAELRGKPTNALSRRLRALELPDGVYISAYDIDSAVFEAGKAKYEDKMLQALEQKRLTRLVELTKTEIQIEKVLNRADDPVLAELAALGIVPAPVWG